MSDMYVDPDKLEDFGASLLGYSQYLNQSILGLNSSLGRLGDSWQDREYSTFREEVKKAQRHINDFVAVVESTIPKINGDVEKIRVYQKLSINN